MGEMNKDREFININAYVSGDIKKSIFKREGEDVKVTNFTLVRKEKGEKIYTNCSAYGRRADEVEELKQGDYIHVFGYINERVKGDRTYKNFIVKHIDININEENKEDK